MNTYKLANELADELENWTDNKEAANMLRQQADYIAMLEAKVNFYAPKDDEGDFKNSSRKELLDYIEYLRELITTQEGQTPTRQK